MDHGNADKQKMVITPEDQMQFERAKSCSICSKPFEKQLPFREEL